MPIVYTPDSAEAQERTKWEAQHTVAGPGGRPYVRRDYPAAWYRAARTDGRLGISETLIVEAETQVEAARDRGFCETPKAAYTAVEQQELLFAKLAAERAFTERRMGPQAQAEAAAADDATHGHLPSVPDITVTKRAGARGVIHA